MNLIAINISIVKNRSNPTICSLDRLLKSNSLNHIPDNINTIISVVVFNLLFIFYLDADIIYLKSEEGSGVSLTLWC